MPFTHACPSDAEEDEEAAQRNITFWRNGFSIEGGAFYSYADPENERLLAEINTGRAPVSVLNVRPGQPVEVVVSKRTNEDYVPEKRPFGGSGNRLGSPVPDVTSMPGSFPAASPSPPTSHAERASVTTLFEVDQTQPTTTVQIRLADGTRMPCRMNLTHTVGDIRNFINACVVSLFLKKKVLRCRQVAAREQRAGVHDRDDIPKPNAGERPGDDRSGGTGEQRGGAAMGVKGNEFARPCSRTSCEFSSCDIIIFSVLRRWRR